MTSLPPPAPGWRDRSSLVDGNALAGALSALLGGEPTRLVAVCATCGHDGPIAETLVEVDDAAFLVRCRTCTHTLFVLQTEGGGVLRLEGLAALRPA